MTVSALDHINICTTDVAGTARFFADVLGMAVTPSPGSADLAKAAWIRDSQGRPIIHLASREMIGGTLGGDVDVAGSGRIHHIALSCSGYADVVSRLQALGRQFRARDAPGRRVLFVAEENGILLELNFEEN